MPKSDIEAVAEARRTKPDVALMDIRMPRMDGLEALQQIANDVNVVVCMTFDHDEYVQTALKNGACVTGDAFISPSINVRLLQHMNTPAPDQLPSRELDVVKLAAWAWETSLAGQK